MTDPDDEGWTDLGHGVSWSPLVDRDGDLVALLERHDCAPESRGVGSLPLRTEAGMRAFPDGPHWTLETQEPITITPSVRCRTCGKHGWIKGGEWVPASDST
jgi:hypothetical protein